MPFPVKKVYRKGSAGANRKQAGVTLNELQNRIRTAQNKTKARRELESLNLLNKSPE